MDKYCGTRKMKCSECGQPATHRAKSKKMYCCACKDHFCTKCGVPLDIELIHRPVTHKNSGSLCIKCKIVYMEEDAYKKIKKIEKDLAFCINTIRCITCGGINNSVDDEYGNTNMRFCTACRAEWGQGQHITRHSRKFSEHVTEQADTLRFDRTAGFVVD